MFAVETAVVTVGRINSINTYVNICIASAFINLFLFFAAYDKNCIVV